MASSKWTLALQALETSLHSTYSEVTQVQRATQADALNFLDQIKNGLVTVPYVLLVAGATEQAEKGSDVSYDLKGVVNVYYIRAYGLTSAEQATWTRIEDWAADKAANMNALVYAWSTVANGPFWVGEPHSDISTDNQANQFLFDKQRRITPCASKPSSR